MASSSGGNDEDSLIHPIAIHETTTRRPLRARPRTAAHPVFEETKQMYDTANTYEERNKTCQGITSHQPWIPLTCHVPHNHRSANVENETETLTWAPMV